jgi:hypothetical protein
MAYRHCRHRVNDYAMWRKPFDDFELQRKQGGERSALELQADGDLNEVTVINAWDSVPTAKACFDSLVLKSTMESAGLAGPHGFLFTDEALYLKPSASPREKKGHPMLALGASISSSSGARLTLG